MASNYVEIKVKASDDAKPDLEALKFDLESIGHKVETAKIEVEDKDASAKLLALNARLADLNRKVSNPRLTAAGAAKVEADIAAVDAALDRLNDKHAKPEVTLKGAAETLAEVEALDHELGKMEDKANTAGSGGGLLEKILGTAGGLPLPAIAALVPVVGALAVEITGVVSGFAAAGAGAGAFALLAKPAVSQVTAAYSGLHAAQQKYANALAQEKLDPSKGHAAAVKTALDQLKLAQQAIGKLPQSEQAAIKGISGLAAEFGKLSKAFQPEAFKVFAAGLGLIQKLLPDIVPFAQTFADVLSKLLGQASKFAGSKGFADWLKQFHSLEGPSLNAIGHGIGQVAVAIGKLLTTMSGKDAAHAINIAFGAISGTINAVARSVRFLMQMWDGAGIAAGNVASAFHKVVGVLDNVRHGFAELGDSILHAITGIPGSIASIASKMLDPFRSVPGKIKAFFAGAASWLVSAGNWVVSGFVKGAKETWSAVSSWFAGLGGKIKAFFSGAAGWLLSAGKAIIQGLINGIESMLGALGGVVGHVVGIVKSIAGALGIHSPSTVMHGYGVNIMEGLLGGIGSKVPDLRSRLGGISGMIGGMGGPGGGRGGGPLQLQVMPGGGSAFEQFMVQAMRNYVRVRGGSVQAVLGH